MSDNEAQRGALALMLAEHRAWVEALDAALDAAERIEPQGSPEWVESGKAMRTTVIREIRVAVARIDAPTIEAKAEAIEEALARGDRN